MASSQDHHDSMLSSLAADVLRIINAQSLPRELSTVEGRGKPFEPLAQAGRANHIILRLDHPTNNFPQRVIVFKRKMKLIPEIAMCVYRPLARRAAACCRAERIQAVSALMVAGTSTGRNRVRAT